MLNLCCVVCVMLDVYDSSGGDVCVLYFCIGVLYYDGGVIEVRAKMDFIGVVFEFCDMVWYELFFEILWCMYDLSGDNVFDIVVFVDGGLNGCVLMFLLITYFDREVG